jgi:RNA polymerase sigma-70 factor (ECF subfamily)
MDEKGVGKDTPTSDLRISAESSLNLVRRAREGDEAALNLLCARYLPSLRRWATGRLPRWARDMRDTDDLVQDTIVGVLPHLDHFEFRHNGAFHAYLRYALMNRIREEIRRANRRPARSDVEIEGVDPAASPLEEAIGKDALESYEAALKRMSAEDQEAIVAKVEMGYSYEQLAEALGKPSTDAARMAVSRALVRLAREMDRHGG